jgi:hypothetical protein
MAGRPAHFDSPKSKNIMKIPFILPLQKYGPATLAALSLAALPLSSHAKDKDDDDHHTAKKHDGKMEDHHKDVPGHKDLPGGGGVVHKKDGPGVDTRGKKGDDVPHHKDMPDHKKGDDVVVHHKDMPEHRKGDDVVVHHKDVPGHKDDVVVHHKDDVVVHRKGGPVVVHDGPNRVVHDRVMRDGVVIHNHHHHRGWALREVDGWRGHGWYYAPLGVRYVEQSPDVVYYTTRTEVPQEYVDAPAEQDTVEALVQKALLDRGYYEGAVDGDLGPMSRRAISRYKADHIIKPDNAEITDELLTALNID